MRVTIVNPILVTPNVTPGAMLQPSVPPPLGLGARLEQMNIVELGAAIARRGHQVTVVVAGPFLQEKAVTLSNGVQVVSVPCILRVPFHPGLFPMTPALETHPAVQEADVVQVGEFHQPSTFFAARAGRDHNVPIVLWQETFRAMRFPGSLYQRGFEATAGRRVLETVRGFVPRTSKARGYLRSLGVKPNRIHDWIPTGLDTSVFAPQTPSASPADFGWSDSGPIFLLVGRLHPVKGVDIALRLMKWLDRTVPDAHLLIRGAGPEDSALRRLARELGIERNVRFLPSVDRATMVRLYNLADVVLLTSRSDLLPFALIEASACGRPCLATDVGAVRDIVVDGETGVVVPSGDFDTLCLRTLNLLQDDERRHQFGLAARKRATMLFDVNRVAGQMEEAYRGAAS